jgi:uncharacterized membrane protein
MGDAYGRSTLEREAEIRQRRIEHEMARAEAYREAQRQINREQRLFTFKFTQLVWLVTGVIEGLIGLRFLLKLMAANPDNSFAEFIYGFTDVFVLPFRGLTATPSAEGFVLEIHSVIAMLVYMLLGWAAARTIWVLLYRPRGTA